MSKNSMITPTISDKNIHTTLLSVARVRPRASKGITDLL